MSSIFGHVYFEDHTNHDKIQQNERHIKQSSPLSRVRREIILCYGDCAVEYTSTSRTDIMCQNTKGHPDAKCRTFLDIFRVTKQLPQTNNRIRSYPVSSNYYVFFPVVLHYCLIENDLDS